MCTMIEKNVIRLSWYITHCYCEFTVFPIDDRASQPDVVRLIRKVKRMDITIGHGICQWAIVINHVTHHTLFTFTFLNTQPRVLGKKNISDSVNIHAFSISSNEKPFSISIAEISSYNWDLFFAINPLESPRLHKT